MDREQAVDLVANAATRVQLQAMQAKTPGQTRELDAVARDLRRVWSILRVDTPRKSE